MRIHVHKRIYHYGASFFITLLCVLGTQALAQNVKSTLQVGVFDNYPIVFKDRDGEIRGIAIDVLETVARQQGWRLRYVHDTWNTVFSRTQSGELDVLLGVAYTPERAQQFKFAQETLLSNWAVVFQSELGRIDSVFDLSNQTVALMENSVHTKAFLHNMEQFDITVTPLLVGDYAGTLLAVEQGRAQAAVVNRVFSLTNANKFRIKPTNIVFNPVDVRFAESSGGDGHIVAAIDAYLRSAKQDRNSAYYQSLNRWLPGIDRPSSQAWRWVLILITGVGLALALYSYSIRRLVKHRTAQLQSSEQRFRHLAEHINEVFWIVAPDWQSVLYISPAYERIWGRSRESLRATPLSWMEQIHPDDRPAVQAVMDQRKSGEPSDVPFPEYRIVRPDGEIRWILTRAYPVKQSDSGNVEYIVGYAADITEFKTTEQALIRSEQRYAQAQKAAKIGSWEWDIQTGEVFWSEMVGPIFGLQPGDSPTSYEDYLTLLHPDEVDRVGKTVAYALEHKSHYTIEHRVIWPDGSLHWIAGRGEVITDAAGNSAKMFGTVQEITETKQAKQALEQTLNQLQALYTATPDMIFLQAPDGSIVDVNDNTPRMLGYTREEMLKLPFERVHGSGFTNAMAADYIQRALNGEPVDFEWQVRKRNGEEFPVEVRLRRLAEEHRQGEAAFVAIVRDISQRKRVDDVLVNLARSVPHEELEEFFQQAVRQLASVYQCRYALIGRLIYPDKIHVQTLAMWADNQHRDNFNYALRGTASQDILSQKTEFIPKDARRLYPEDRTLQDMQVESCYGTPLLSSKGEILGLVSVMNDRPMDISNWNAPILNILAARLANELERAQAISELHARDERLRRQQLALRNLSKEQAIAEDEPETVIRDTTEITAQALAVERVSIWLYDDSGDAIHCVDLYEHSRRQHSAGSELTQDDNPEYFRAIEEDRIIAANEAQDAAETRAFNEHYLQPHGITSMMDAPIRRGRKIIGVLCNEHVVEPRHWTVDEQNFASSVADIISMTLELWEHKNTAEQLRQHREHLEDKVAERTRELAAVNQELEAFAYSVSHDLRSPLRAVDGFALILEEDYASHLDDEAKDYLHRMRAASQRMGELIEALLNLSRLTRNKLKPVTVDLTAMAQDISHTLQETEPQRNVTINIMPAMQAYADAAMLRIVMQNLLDNAWKYTRRCSQTVIDLGMIKENKQTVYFVRDNGAGFNPEHSKKLFGAFQRLHRQDEFEGIGIGLATVQRIIHRHGGRVWADSKPGEGASFYFTLGID